MPLPKDSARVNRPKNLNDSEIAAILISTKHIPYEDIEILEETVKIRYPYHPAGGTRDTEFQQALDAASAAKEHRETDEEYLPQRCKDYVAKAVLAEFQENQALKEKLAKAETERKQQDILVAELTQKVIRLEKEQAAIVKAFGLQVEKRDKLISEMQTELAEIATFKAQWQAWNQEYKTAPEGSKASRVADDSRQDVAYQFVKAFLWNTPAPAPEAPSLREQVLRYLQEQKAGKFPNTALSAIEIAEGISLLHEPQTEAVIEVLTELANEGLIYTHGWLGIDEKRYILAQAK